jgi:ATP-binding cassette, subfamily B (MDR/TAP), member 1
LLERFYAPQSGHILSDSLDIAKVPLSSYRSSISLVAQEASIMSGTISENVVLGLAIPPPSSCASCENKDKVELEARINSACRAAGIHDFITSLPEGYDTAVGAKGLALSGVCSPISLHRAVTLFSRSSAAHHFFTISRLIVIV